MASRCQKLNVRLDHICQRKILTFLQHIDCSRMIRNLVFRDLV